MHRSIKHLVTSVESTVHQHVCYTASIKEELKWNHHEFSMLKAANLWALIIQHPCFNFTDWEVRQRRCKQGDACCPLFPNAFSRMMDGDHFAEIFRKKRHDVMNLIQRKSCRKREERKWLFIGPTQRPVARSSFGGANKIRKKQTRWPSPGQQAQGAIFSTVQKSAAVHDM